MLLQGLADILPGDGVGRNVEAALDGGVGQRLAKALGSVRTAKQRPPEAAQYWHYRAEEAAEDAANSSPSL